MRKPFALLAALLLTTSLAAGCGDDGDDDAGDGSTSVEGGDGAATDDTDGSDDTTTTTEGESPDDTGDGSTTTTFGEPSNPDSEYCEAARTFANDPDIANLDFTKPEDIQHGVDLLTGLRDAAPADLQDDLDIVIEGFRAVAGALAEAGDDPAAQQAAVDGLEGQFDSIAEASTNVQTFTQEQCGIDVAGTGGTPTG